MSEGKRRFNSITAQLLYLSKRVRPDILTSVAFLRKRVLNPQRGDFNKLVRTIQYLRGTHDMGIVLGVQDPPCVYAYVDASYAVHPDMKSHTGCVISLGMGPIYAKSSTQRLNTKSSMEAELVGLSDCNNQAIWSRNFLIQQGYVMPPAVMFQDNMSTI